MHLLLVFVLNFYVCYGRRGSSRPGAGRRHSDVSLKHAPRSILTSVGDSDPDPQHPHVFILSLPDPDP